MEAATAVLGRQGYAATSLKDVAEEAGIAPGLLHYYFSTKEELLLEVVARIDAEVSADWQAAVAEHDDPLRRIAAAIDQAIATCRDKREQFRLIFELFSVSLENSNVRARCQRLLDNFMADIRREIDVISEGLPLPLDALGADFDFPAAMAGGFHGIALVSLVMERDPERAYRSYKAFLLSLAALSYVVAGEQPPLDRLLEMLGPTAGKPGA